MFLILPSGYWLKTKTKAESRKQKPLCNNCLFHQQTTLISCSGGLKSPLCLELSGILCSLCTYLFSSHSWTFRLSSFGVIISPYYFYPIKMHTTCQCWESRAVFCCRGLCYTFFPLPFVEKLRVACNFILTCKRILEGWDGDGGGVEREKARSIISAPRTEAGHMGLKRWWNERIL